jgi:hypothetical protein
MPTVPQYEPGRIAARPLNAPQVGVSASSASFGARTAQAVGELGRGVFDFGMMLKARDERDRAKKDKETAGNLALQAEIELKTAMESGVFAKRGVDASNASADAQKAAEEIRRKFSSQLKGDDQTALFSAQFDHASRQYLLGAVEHQTQQLQVAETTRRAAENQTAVERAVFFRNSPALIADAEKTLEANTRAEFGGLPEKADETMRERRAALHLGVVNGFLQDGEEARAMAHLEANKGALGEELVGKVKAGVELRQTQREILGMVDAGASEDDIAAAVAARVSDPGKADDLLRYANTFLATRRRSEAAQSKAATESAWAELEKTRDPSAIKAGLPREVRHQMQEWLQKGAVDADPEPGLFEEIMRSSPETRRKMANNPAIYSEARRRLGGSKSKWWQTVETKLQDELAGKVDEKKAGAAKGFLSDQELANKTFDALAASRGVSFGTKDEEAKRRNGFLLRYDRELIEAQEAQGEKPLTREQKESIASKLLIAGSFDDGSWFSSPRRFAFEAERARSRFSPELPEEQAALIPRNANVEYDDDSGEFVAEVAGGRELIRPATGERARRKPAPPRKSTVAELGEFLDATGRMGGRMVMKAIGGSK